MRPQFNAASVLNHLATKHAAPEHANSSPRGGGDMSLSNALRRLEELAIFADNHIASLAAVNADAQQLNSILAPLMRPVTADLAELSKAPPPANGMLDELHRSIDRVFVKLNTSAELVASIRSVLHETTSVIEGDRQD